VNTAEAVIRRLETHGVRHVFGIPGTHNLPLYRHLSGSSLRHVTPRHEQGGGYAADGYARATGRPAVCLTTTGPGLLNTATPVATAYADSIPMLVISPGMSDSVAGTDGGHLHELRDQRGIMRLLARESLLVRDPLGAAEAIDRAFASFARERPRPIHLEIPIDRMDVEGPEAGPPVSDSPPPPLDQAVLRMIAARLESATRAALVFGGGAVGAAAEALTLAEALQAPVVTTVNGRGIVPESDPLSLGASIRLPACQQFLRDCDTVLAVGTELAQSDLWRDTPLELDGELCRIDIDPAQLHRNAAARLTLAGDAGDALRGLLAELDGAEDRDRGASGAAEVSSAIAAEALLDGAAFAELMEALRGALDPGTVIAGDSAMACYYGAVHLLPQSEPRRFLYPTGFATLGYGLPAGIGAQLADPGRPVLVLMGDGGALFTIAELATAVELELALPVLIVNNGGYGEIRREMAALGQEAIGVNLNQPDFCSVGRAFGAAAESLEDLSELPRALTEAWSASVPTVIEVRL
jgi:acetolactate synthase-1/2/3 large subunit